MNRRVKRFCSQAFALLALGVSSAVFAEDKGAGAPASAIVQKSPAQKISYADSILRAKARLKEYENKLTYLENDLSDNRKNLIAQIELVLMTYPNGRYNSEILFRLAELYYQKEVAGFDKALAKYEEDMERYDRKEIPRPPVFPGYSFKKTISIYEWILQDYPKSSVADDAMYYQALCIEKEKGEKESVQRLEQMVEVYPQSDYKVAAYMKMGAYYFDHPKDVKNNYDKAALIYKKVLAYRESVSFVEALYRLGWCYYMKDDYGEAISVFKYLIEEVELDFALHKKRILAMKNPLLREEAIDYIAVSFHESGKLEDILKFLTLTGDRDYASKVLMRYGGLKEEQLEYPEALGIYETVYKKFPLSAEAPFAHMAVVRCYERMEKPDMVEKGKSLFFDRYARGSKWSNENKDFPRIREVDKTAINMLLAANEKILRDADGKNDKRVYEKVRDNYKKLTRTYPGEDGSYEAHWNLAVILDQNLQDYYGAKQEYLKVSRDYKGKNKHKKAAALNAVAMAQKILSSLTVLPPDSLMATKKLETEARELIKTCGNFLTLFPDDKKENSEILLIVASTFYNRGIFQKAIKYFTRITEMKPRTAEYERAVQFVARSYTGLKEYVKASEWYYRLYNETASEEVRKEAFKRIVESKYRIAENVLRKKEYKKAAKLLLQIAEEYPQSEYADIVLFNAAESYEKLKDWKSAAETYRILVDRYPFSKYAQGALFNAALDYEKLEDFETAAIMYESLVNQYPKSEQVRDALFNSGLCYERLKQYDKVAEINERFVTMFPDAKDVGRMLFESAKFYKRIGNLEKAYSVFKRYCKMFPDLPRVIEAYYTAGSIMLELGNRKAALLDLGTAVKLNEKQKKAGGTGNDYYTAEAIFEIAGDYHQQYLNYRITGAGNKQDRSRKAKSEAMQMAIQEYRKVATYKTTRIFETLYKIGTIYEDFAFAYWQQARPKIKNPLKKIVKEKAMASAVAQLLEKAVIPYEKIIEMAAATKDTIPAEAVNAIDSSKVGMARTLYYIGDFHLRGAVLLENSPLPKAIEKDIFQRSLYISKLLQTTFPIKKQAMAAWIAARKKLKKQKLKNEFTEMLDEKLGTVNYNLGYDFEKLSIALLNDPELPAGLDEDEREELVFQLEDIAYEIQDKALENYQDALDLVKAEEMGEVWEDRIIDRLSILDPDNFSPRKAMLAYSLASGPSWRVSTDTAEGWKMLEFKDRKWRKARKGDPPSDAKFNNGAPDVIWAGKSDSVVYFRQHFYLRGKPVSGSVQITAADYYRLDINQTFIAKSDTASSSWGKVDSHNVKSFLKGGDNIITIQAKNFDKAGFGLAVLLQAKVDSSQKVPPSKIDFLTYTKEDKQAETTTTPSDKKAEADTAKEKMRASVKAKAEKKQTAKAVKEPVEQPAAPVESQKVYATSDELLAAVEQYKKQEVVANKKIRREKVLIKNLKYKLNYHDKKIETAKKEIELIRRRLESIRRKR